MAASDLEPERKFTCLSILTVITFVVTLCILILVVIGQTKSSSNGPNGDTSTRLDLEGARKAIPDSEFPTELLEYEINASSTGLYPNWATSSDDLGKLCSVLTLGLQYAHHNRNTNNANLCVMAVEDFLIKYNEQLTSSGMSLTQTPWGTDWYQFSVVSANMLAYYILLPNKSLIDLASDTILLVITNPKKSFDADRIDDDSVAMAGPYLLAKTVKGLEDTVFDSDEYKYVVEFLKLKMVRKRGANGLHLDSSYIVRNYLVDYLTIHNLNTKFTQYLYALDTKISTPVKAVWRHIQNIILHPTVSTAFIGLMGRNNSLTIDTNESSPYGIKVCPFNGYIRYFTKEYQFSMRGQIKPYYWTEIDSVHNTQAFYWVQYRNVHTKNTSPTLTFPDAGFIYLSDKTPNPLSSGGGIIGLSTSVSSAFVFAYGRYGILWHKYNISFFGPQTVTELIVIDSTTNIITVNVYIYNRLITTSLVYYSSTDEVSIDQYRSKLIPIPLPDTSEVQFKTVFDLNKGTVKTTSAEPTTTDFMPITLDDGITIDYYNDYPILYKNAIPKLAYLESTPYQLDKFIIEGLASFAFNKTSNQYEAEVASE
uniref:Occlusion derived virus envelope protein 66 n=1 Tax=Oryctes rhinoceros nudivirus TaxID=92521 RepID=A3QU06_9VIRU|nr:occlusion derived virus envelope protein 66 [Oryctes rhinoceros nudivirus]QHG11251.1 odv-e66 protein [Oryctes rhinoceros nudivirus]UBR58194.1 ODV-E66 protein [Oryctes rhinoceros nudivirus]WDA64468.1 ODV-E66 protein [Oryctes rhinoceros nudivirus]WDA64964.1 ODV-E66 protein [Oryctes rhinoceros nudivirus]